MASLIVDKVDFSAKDITKDKESFSNDIEISFSKENNKPKHICI